MSYSLLKLLSRNLNYHVSIILCIGICIQHRLALAQTDQVCEDLLRLSCTAGKHEDGTGWAQIQGEAFSPDAGKKIEDKLLSEIKYSLKQKNNNYFVKSALSATGMVDSPDCYNSGNAASENLLLSERCTENLAKGIYKILLKTAGLIPIPKNNMQARSFKDLMSFVDTSSFQKLHQVTYQIISETLAKRNTEALIDKKIFPGVKSLIIKKINSWPVDESVKTIMRDKINAINFAGTNCSTNPDQVDGLIRQNAFIQGTNFKVCNGILSNSTSEFTLATIIAHELAHAIDPCGITSGPSDFTVKAQGANASQADKNHVLSNLLQCLRSGRSIGALSYQNILHSEFMGMLNGSTYANVPTQAYDYCFKSPLTNGNIAGDQIVESFADWMAAEITPEYIDMQYTPKGSSSTLTKDNFRIGYSNFGRALCTDYLLEDTMEFSTDIHPNLKSRLNRILLANPKIRAQMGCPPLDKNKTELLYCHPDIAYTAKELGTELNNPSDRNKTAPAIIDPNLPIKETTAPDSATK